MPSAAPARLTLSMQYLSLGGQWTRANDTGSAENMQREIAGGSISAVAVAVGQRVGAVLGHGRAPLIATRSPACASTRFFCNDREPTEIYTVSLHDDIDRRSMPSP